MWLLLLQLLELTIWSVLVLLVCAKSPSLSNRSKEKCLEAKTLRRDLAVANNDAPSCQGSVYSQSASDNSVHHTISKNISQSGQRPKSRQVPMSDSFRSKYKSTMSKIQVTSKPSDSVQLSVQQPSSQLTNYYQKSDEENEEKSRVTVNSS